MSSTHYFLRTENRSICHGSEFLNNISIARAGNFIMYVAAPLSWKRSINCLAAFNGKLRCYCTLQTVSLCPTSNTFFHSFLCWERILSIIPQSSLVAGLSTDLS